MSSLPPRRHWFFVVITFFLSLIIPATVTAQEPTASDKVLVADIPTAPTIPAPTPSRPAYSQTFSNFMPAGIPDNGYIGTLDGNDGFGTDAGMVCTDINTAAQFPAGVVVYDASLRLRMNHTAVGDLTLKLRAPNGQILTLLNRPRSTATDDGVDTPKGAIAPWTNSLITFSDTESQSAESMGVPVPNNVDPCTFAGYCFYHPYADTATTTTSRFFTFRTTAAAGTWTLCAGDSASGDTGTLNFWQLNLTTANLYTNTTTAPIPDDGYLGGFGGAGQLCRDITVASPTSPTVVGAAIDTNLTHTWVGDLTMKLRSPNLTILTILNRPGTSLPDDGTNGSNGTFGNPANWNGFISFADTIYYPEAEQLGYMLTTDQVICTDSGSCLYDPSPDTATQLTWAFSGFNGSAAAGTWTLCLGDSMVDDAGTFNAWRLYLQRPAISLAILLEDMNATATENGVRVAWETASEVDNIGFHLYRTTDPALMGERLTEELIPSASPGSGQGAIYEWVDESAQAGVAYYYTLEDIDVNGVGTAHAPVPITPDAPTVVMVDNISAQPIIGIEWLSLLGLVGVGAGIMWRKLQG